MCIFLCKLQFSVFVGRLASIEFISEKKKITFACSCTSGSFTFVSLSSSANQSNCLLLLRNVFHLNFVTNFRFLRVLPLSELLSVLGLKCREAWFKIISISTPVYLPIYLFIYLFFINLFIYLSTYLFRYVTAMYLCHPRCTFTSALS